MWSPSISASLLGLVAALRSVTPLLNGTSQWQYISARFEENEAFVLVEFRRDPGLSTRELLTADFETTPIAYQNASSRLWEIAPAYSSVETWAHRDAYHFLQIPAKRSSVCASGRVIGVFFETMLPLNLFKLTMTFHDGSLCPAKCSSHGGCESGLCTCSEGWAGRDCSYAVQPISEDLKLDFDFGSENFTLEVDRNAAAVKWDVTEGSSEVRLCVLQGPYGKYQVPSDNYASECQNGRKGRFTVTQKLPMFINLSLNSEASASLVFSFSKETSNSEPLYVVVLVGVLVPCGVFVLFASSVAYVLRSRGERRLRRSPSPPLSAPQPLVIPEVPSQKNAWLDQCAPVTSYGKIVSAYSSECSVCLDQFEDDSVVRMLQCGHVYHSSCLEHLASVQQSCCICKQNFEKKAEASLLTTIEDITHRRECGRLHIA